MAAILAAISRVAPPAARATTRAPVSIPVGAAIRIFPARTTIPVRIIAPIRISAAATSAAATTFPADASRLCSPHRDHVIDHQPGRSQQYERHGWEVLGPPKGF